MKIYAVQILAGFLFISELMTHGVSRWAAFFFMMLLLSSGFNAYVEAKER